MMNESMAQDGQALSSPTTADVEKRSVDELSEAPRPRRTTFWLALWLGVVLVGCKAYHVLAPQVQTVREYQRYFTDLAVVSYHDVLYTLCIALAGQALLWLSHGREILQRTVWSLIVFVALISVVYGVIAARVFEILRMPLTYALLYMAGDAKNMKSSVLHFVNIGEIALLIGVPLGYILLLWLTNRRVQRRRGWGVRTAQLLGLAMLMGAVAYGHQQREEWASGHDNRRIADNPHYVLAASFVREFMGGQSVRLDGHFPPEFLDDFKMVSERRVNTGPTPGLARGPKNVILVVLESVGSQFLSLYGSEHRTTPRLEAEAGNALVFNNFYSHITNTPNSLVSLAISVYPPMTWREWTVEQPDVPGTTVAQVLKAKGYSTAFISAGNNEFSNQDAFLKHRGFDVVLGGRDTGCPPLNSWGVEDKCLVNTVLKYIDQQQGKPFYVMCWNQGTHHPYGAEYGMDADGWEIVPFKVDEARHKNMSWDLGRYLNALHETDRQLGRLFDELRARGLDEDTIVIVTGDHGEAFAWPHPQVGHSGKVNEEDVHVPFLIWSPALFSGAGRTDAVGAHVDISPTILDLLNVEYPGSWQGQSMFAPDRRPRAYSYGAMDSYYYGVREGPWKYIYNATLGSEELFNVVEDRLEQKNVASQNVERCKEMRGRLAAWMQYQQQLMRGPLASPK